VPTDILSIYREENELRKQKAHIDHHNGCLGIVSILLNNLRDLRNLRLTSSRWMILPFTANMTYRRIPFGIINCMKNEYE
jgi:hypothetical protein